MPKLAIGGVRIPNRLVLAPMADVNRPSFRLLCRKRGAGLLFTEMINAEGVVRGSERTLMMTKVRKDERPIALQLFGSKPGTIAKAAAAVEGRASIIDINCGCPVQKVTKNGAGCALMKEPEKIGAIVKEVVNAVSIPVTVKLRLGISAKYKNFLDVAKAAESAGASALTLHARTCDEGYSGRADWSAIKKLKDSVGIPVIGNGDVRTPQDCKRMLHETGCDFVMIGRATMGNPSLFEQCERYLRTGRLLPQQTAEERLADLKLLFRMHKKYDGMSPGKSFVFVKQQAIMFTTGLHGSVAARARLEKAKNEKGLLATFSELVDNI
ncbi:MAG: tRNA dihydrouridine synthase DusB [Candidatus Aenigmarchaeota archaeon]|nr:tRNA dihydrouridine synthase DusB [Candidatus Aenigmarchaeota archaeon]